jgi:predicted transcriptional regulator
VLNEERVVLGLLRAEDLRSGGGEVAERAMHSGPSTFRPHVPIGEMAEYMIEHDLASVPVTTSDGRLLGMLRTKDAAEAALKVHREHEHRAG